MREGEQTGAGQGQGAGAERGGREGALPRDLLRIVLTLAGGQTVRDGRAGKGACCSRASVCALYATAA